eukprot:m51a1_g1412 hypothetical protein (256) ;mRNA; f:20911-22086
MLFRQSVIADNIVPLLDYGSRCMLACVCRAARAVCSAPSVWRDVEVEQEVAKMRSLALSPVAAVASSVRLVPRHNVWPPRESDATGALTGLLHSLSAVRAVDLRSMKIGETVWSQLAEMRFLVSVKADSSDFGWTALVYKRGAQLTTFKCQSEPDCLRGVAIALALLGRPLPLETLGCVSQAEIGDVLSSPEHQHAFRNLRRLDTYCGADIQNGYEDDRVIPQLHQFCPKLEAVGGSPEFVSQVLQSCPGIRKQV